MRHIKTRHISTLIKKMLVVNGLALLQSPLLNAQNQIHFFDNDFVPWSVDNSGNVYGFKGARPYTIFESKLLDFDVFEAGDPYRAERSGDGYIFHPLTEHIGSRLKYPIESELKSSLSLKQLTKDFLNKRSASAGYNLDGKTSLSSDIEHANFQGYKNIKVFQNHDYSVLNSKLPMESLVEEKIVYLNDHNMICTWSASEGLRQHNNLAPIGADTLRISPDGKVFMYRNFTSRNKDELLDVSTAQTIIVKGENRLVIQNSNQGEVKLKEISDDGSFVVGTVFLIHKGKEIPFVLRLTNDLMRSHSTLSADKIIPGLMFTPKLSSYNGLDSLDHSVPLIVPMTNYKCIIPLLNGLKTQTSTQSSLVEINSIDLLKKLFEKFEFLNDQFITIRQDKGDYISYMTIKLSATTNEILKLRDLLPISSESYNVLNRYYTRSLNDNIDEPNSLLMHIIYSYNPKNESFKGIKWGFMYDLDDNGILTNKEIFEKNIFSYVKGTLGSPYSPTKYRHFYKRKEMKALISVYNEKFVDLTTLKLVKTKSSNPSIDVKKFIECKNFKITAVSPDGRYVCGFCDDEDKNGIVGFCIDLSDYINTLKSQRQTNQQNSTQITVENSDRMDQDHSTNTGTKRKQDQRDQEEPQVSSSNKENEMQVSPSNEEAQTSEKRPDKRQRTDNDSINED